MPNLRDVGVRPAVDEEVEGRAFDIVREFKRLQRAGTQEEARAYLEEHSEEIEKMGWDVDVQLAGTGGSAHVENHAEYLRDKMRANQLEVPSGSYLLLRDDGAGGVEVEFFCRDHVPFSQQFDLAIKGI